jgi:hypothetical protein
MAVGDYIRQLEDQAVVDTEVIAALKREIEIQKARNRDLDTEIKRLRDQASDRELRYRDAEEKYHTAREAVWTLVDIFGIDTDGG